MGYAGLTTCLFLRGYRDALWDIMLDNRDPQIDRKTEIINTVLFGNVSTSAFLKAIEILEDRP